MAIFKKKEKQEVKDEKPLTKKEKITNLIFTILQIVMVVVCVAISIFIIVNPGGYREKPEDCNTNMMLVMTDSMEPTIMTNDLIFGEEVLNEVLPLGTVVTFAVETKDGYYLDTHRIVGYIMAGNTEETIGDTKYVYFIRNSIYDEYTALAEYPGYTIIKYATRGDKMSLIYCDDGNATSIEQINDFTGFKKNLQTGEFELDESGSKIINNRLIDGTGYSHSEILAVVNENNRVTWLGNMLRFLQDPLAFALIILLPLVLLFAYNIFLIVKMVIADRTEKARAQVLAEVGANQINEEEIKRKAIEEYLASLKKDE